MMGVMLHSMGSAPCIVMALCVIVENVARSVILMITMWDNIQYLVTYYIFADLESEQLHSVHFEMTVLIAMVTNAFLLLPTIWMLSFSDLALDSLLGFVSTIVLSLCVAINFAEDFETAERLSNDLTFWPRDLYGIVLCFGVMTSSLAGHACLPSIYEQMERKRDYAHCLNVSWMIIFCVNMMTGIVGYLTYGDSVDLLLTESMMKRGGTLSTITIICIIVNLLAHVPIGVAISSSLPESVLQFRHHIIRRVFRLIFYSVITYMAWLLRDHVLAVSAFMGSVTTWVISGLCPLLGQLKMRFHDQNTNRNVQAVVVAIVLCAFAVASGFMLFADLQHRE